LTPSKAADGTTTLSAGEIKPVAPYRGPGPPPPSAPHRYVFLLYEQPEGFDAEKFAPGGQPMSRPARMRYDYDAFAKEANLGPVIASTYFLSN
jgi:phosphatidylethanolamine-binding protein